MLHYKFNYITKIKSNFPNWEILKIIYEHKYYQRLIIDQCNLVWWSCQNNDTGSKLLVDAMMDKKHLVGYCIIGKDN